MTRLLLRDNAVDVLADGPALPGDTVATEDVASSLLSVAPQVFEAWSAGQSYNTNDIVSYDNRLWRVIQAHVSQTDWAPDIAASLFVKTWPDGTIPTWRQPLGSHDAYPLRFEVYHEPTDRIWVSLIPANTTVPGSDPRWWTLRDDQEPLEPVTGEWVSGEQVYRWAT